MRTRLTLRPHQRGAKRLLAQYGDRLVCVRHRYDTEQKKRWKTIELIIEEQEWEPSPVSPTANQMMYLRIAGGEVDLRRQVKAAGGKWRPQQQVWELRYEQVVALGLTERIVTDRAGIYR
jgi:hypothetical protein